MGNLTAILRRHARGLALVLSIAMLLPILASVFPTPAMSAEEQLMADLGNSVCSPNVFQHQPGEKDQPAGMHGQCCILCGTQLLVLAPPEQPAIVLEAHRRQQEAVQVATLDVAPRERPCLDSSSPRGPPHSLSA